MIFHIASTFLPFKIELILMCCLFFKPKVVTDTDEIELSKQLAELEKMNAEVGGDDSPDEMPSEEDEPEQ